MEKTVENGKKSVIVVGGGIMGLGTCLHLAERGYKVTLLEKQSDVAKVASYINGAMICPSMTASWASLKLLSQVCSVLYRLGVRPFMFVLFIVTYRCTFTAIFKCVLQ